MPMYEYQCNRCAEITEKIFSTYKNVPRQIPCKMLDCGGVGTKILSKGSFVMLDAFGDSVKMGSN